MAVANQKSRVLSRGASRQQPSDSTDLLTPDLLIFEGKPETQTFMWELWSFHCWFFFFFNFAWDTQNTSRTWIFFFDLCVANSLSWLLVLCGLFLPHLSNMGSCCYFRCPVFWLDLTLLSPDSGDPSLVSGLAPLPGHPHMGHLSCPLLVLWDPAETLMPESVSPFCTLNSSLWSFMVEDFSYKCLIFTNMLPSFSGQRLNMGSVLKAW